MARDRPSPYDERKAASTTVARGTGPRDLPTSAKNARSLETPDVCCSARCMARDRPSPYGESGKQAWRGTGPRPTVNGAVLDTVARGPVPRDLPTSAKNARSPETPDVCCSARCMARDRPSPYGESGNQAWRGTGPRPTAKGASKHGEGLSPRR